ncbi:hypothetical protein RYH80_19550 [Halobaculum sp. MBLA0147]|uniref:hypothetical protein n=1 Tax=Halobaculum sp. MBLA0147 TaxID=3079934 RepID=UPI0035236498
MGVPLPVEPTVYVERVSNHVSCAWTADSMEQFVDAVVAETEVADPFFLVAAKSTAGRHRRRRSELDGVEGVTYLRCESSDPWRAACERRTAPVITLDSFDSPARCRRLHCATTARSEWPDEAVARLGDLLDYTEP